jgi:hypothetical protein
MDADPTPIRIPGRCAACGRAGHDALTLHTRREQITATILGITWHVWDANDGDLVTCDCGARYVCRDLGDGRIEVVGE